MPLRTALRVIRLSAIYDLVITVGFAFTVTATLLFTGLGELHRALGLAGATPDAAEPFTLMFANLMGSVVTVWALYRIFRPSLAAGTADIGARLLFSLGMIAALLQGASPLVLVMLVLELAWAAAQAIAIVAAVRSGAAERRTSVGAAAIAES